MQMQINVSKTNSANNIEYPLDILMFRRVFTLKVLGFECYRSRIR